MRRQMNRHTAREYLLGMLAGRPALPIVGSESHRDALRLAVKALAPVEACPRCKDLQAEIDALTEAFSASWGGSKEGRR